MYGLCLGFGGVDLGLLDDAIFVGHIQKIFIELDAEPDS